MIIGEALRQALILVPEYEARITDAPTIIAFRNRLVHGYMAIEHDTVWGVIEGDLPLLKRQVGEILDEPRAEGAVPSPD